MKFSVELGYSVVLLSVVNIHKILMHYTNMYDFFIDNSR